MVAFDNFVLHEYNDDDSWSNYAQLNMKYKTVHMTQL